MSIPQTSPQDASVPLGATTLVEGDVVNGRYEIVRVLGQGGFATVYLARQRAIDRLVAIKVLDAIGRQAQSKAFRRRFLEEARAAALLRHPNVVTIYDYGLIEGADELPFIAMEHLEGRDLDVVITRHGALEAPRALALFRGPLAAVAAAHRRGIVHKDLKPANLFLHEPPDGPPSLVILDFGVARQTTTEDKLTQSGQITGTPQYLSPEYIDRQMVSPQLDVYQMGLVLVEMLTGRPAVRANSMLQMCVAHCRGLLDIPPVLRDSPLGPVLRRALALDLGVRFPDCERFAEALDQLDPTTVPSFVGGTASTVEPIVSEIARLTDEVQAPTLGDFDGGRITSEGSAASGLITGDDGGAGWLDVPSDTPVELQPPTKTSGPDTGELPTERFQPVVDAPDNDEKPLAGFAYKLLIAVLLLGIAVGLSVVLTREDAESIGASDAEESPASAVDSVGVDEGGGGTATGTGATEPASSGSDTPTAGTAASEGSADGSEGSAEATVVVVASEPTDAQVTDVATDELLGRTPLAVEVGPDGREVRLLADGLPPRVVTLDGSDDKAIVALEPDPTDGSAAAEPADASESATDENERGGDERADGAAERRQKRREARERRAREAAAKRDADQSAEKGDGKTDDGGKNAAGDDTPFIFAP